MWPKSDLPKYISYIDVLDMILWKILAILVHPY